VGGPEKCAGGSLNSSDLRAYKIVLVYAGMLNRRGNLNRLVPPGSTRSVWALEENPERDREVRWAIWLRTMAQGDLQALSFLYDDSSALLFGLVLRVLRDRKAAEEALIEIYERVWCQAAGFDGRDQKPSVWLINLARNLAVDRLRRNGASATRAPEIFRHRNQTDDIGVQRPPKEQRSILEMTYLDGFTAGDVAASLDVSTEYVKGQIVLALRNLQAASCKSSHPTS
jgi:DNA-directed RNA polymerase specialized sigma24 family protein